MRYCNKCEGKVVSHAFSTGQCVVCGGETPTSHLPPDKACDECADELDLCKSCGGIYF